MWFETTIRIDRMQGDGLTKKVTECFLVDAVTFGEAEERITKEQSVFGDMEVKGVKLAKYTEVLKGDKEKYFSVKFAFITIDERSGKEKETKCVYLVNANDIDNAKKEFVEYLNNTMIDYAIKSVSETKILDIYEIEKG